MTTQPIQALENPFLKNLIQITAHATNSVNILGRNATRKHIINTFKKKLTEL